MKCKDGDLEGATSQTWRPMPKRNSGIVYHNMWVLKDPQGQKVPAVLG